MQFIKKPSELAPKSTITVLIYGQPGIGKTTLGCSAPYPVLFDADGGVQRINGAHQVPTVQVSSWSDVQNAIAEIKEAEGKGELICGTIVVDTVGKLLDYMSADIIARDPKMGQRDGSLSLKGYGVRKMMFINFIKQLSVMGKNVVFIAHEREDRQGEETVKRPEIGGSSANDLIKELDLVGYMRAIGKERTISFDPNEAFYAKNTCNLAENIKIPVVVDAASGEAVGNNNFLVSIIKTYEASQEKSRQRTADFENLILNIDKVISEVKSIEQLNEATKAIGKMDVIFNSKLVAGQKLNSKAREIGAKYDSTKKAYVSAS